MNPDAAPELAELQALLYRLIVAPNGVADALANDGDATNLESIIIGDSRMSAAARAEIYSGAYFYRLLDALKEDFPATLAVMGGDEFHNLITGYLIAYPPTEPSLLYAGRYLADYFDQSPMLTRWPYIADLARLERALIESFHAADFMTLDRAAVEAIAPHDWPSLKLRFHPATHFLDAQWRVDEIVRAVAQDSEPPQALALPVRIIVWRKDAQVFYRTVEAVEAVALALIAQGSEFEAICETIGAGVIDENAIPQLINRLLVRWLDDGIFLNQSAA